MTIAALLSGGVDSSVAVHLLCEQGYRPDLYYIKIGMDDDGYSCPQEEDLEIVQAMARRYGLPYEVVDLQQEYWDQVVAYTIDRVRRGLTPNPDVMCNRLIKFGAFERQVGHRYDRTATGHYAQVVREGGHAWLATAPDPVKDQTDFLAQLTGMQVGHSLFPIGHMAKDEVRRVAGEARLPSAHRKDSQGICFLGKIDYNQFIERFLGRREGPIVELETGRVLGRHQGYWFHTIGQRKGLCLSGGPWFVVRKDVEANVIYVSRGYQPEAQMRDELTVKAMHWITLDPFAPGAEVPGLHVGGGRDVPDPSVGEGQDVSGLGVGGGREVPAPGIGGGQEVPGLGAEGGKEVPGPCAGGGEVLFKIRHVAELRRGWLRRMDDGSCHLRMERPTNGVAPGQFCVVYTPDARLCLGSGEIAWGE